MRRALLLKSAAGIGALTCLAAPPARAALTLSADAKDAFTVTVVANGLSQPTDMAELPDGRIVITQRTGDVAVIPADGSDAIEAGTINVYPEFGEQGLLGVVADPDFATNHFLYFYASAGQTSEDVNKKHKIYKIALGADGKLDSARNTIVDGLRASRSSVDGGASNHNGGGMVIYKGKLYVALGDTGHNATPPTNHLAACLNVANGKILRFNLDGTTPDDNPLAGESMVTACVNSGGSTVDDWKGPFTMAAPDKRIFAWGMRNPYRFWIDSKTDRMWVGDVGETTREEISTGSPITGDGGKGEHYGWPFNEGTTAYNISGTPNSCTGEAPSRACIAPQYDYGHSMSNNCVIGGLIPDGCGWAAPWNQKYIFGDYGSGNIWTLDVKDDRSGAVTGSVKDFAKSSGVGSFRMGANGALYIAEVAGGVVDKLLPTGYDPTMCTPAGSGGMGSGGMGAGGGSAGGSNPSGGAGPASGGTGPASGGNTGTSGGTSGTGQTAGTSSTMGGTSNMGSGGTGTSGAGRTGSAGGTTSAGGTSTTGGTGTGRGGSTSTAGTGTSNGTGGSKGGDDSGGCGCRVGGRESGAGSALALSGLLGLVALRRRRVVAKR